MDVESPVPEDLLVLPKDGVRERRVERRDGGELVIALQQRGRCSVAFWRARGRVVSGNIPDQAAEERVLTDGDGERVVRVCDPVGHGCDF